VISAIGDRGRRRVPVGSARTAVLGVISVAPPGPMIGDRGRRRLPVGSATIALPARQRPTGRLRLIAAPLRIGDLPLPEAAVSTVRSVVSSRTADGPMIAVRAANTPTARPAGRRLHRPMPVSLRVQVVPHHLPAVPTGRRIEAQTEEPTAARVRPRLGPTAPIGPGEPTAPTGARHAATGRAARQPSDRTCRPVRWPR